MTFKNFDLKHFLSLLQLIFQMKFRVNRYRRGLETCTHAKTSKSGREYFRLGAGSSLGHVRKKRRKYSSPLLDVFTCIGKVKIWFLRKSLSQPSVINYENCHLCDVKIKLDWENKIWNCDNVGVNEIYFETNFSSNSFWIPIMVTRYQSYSHFSPFSRFYTICELSS